MENKKNEVEKSNEKKNLFLRVLIGKVKSEKKGGVNLPKMPAIKKEGVKFPKIPMPKK